MAATHDHGISVVDIVKVANENVGISEDAPWLILKDPVTEIKKAVDDKDYFKMVAYACSVFEYCGKQILVWDSKKTGKQLPKKKGYWSLYDIIEELREREKITDTETTKLHCIRCLRNSFVHEDSTLKFTSAMAKKVNAFIDDIISCTELIFKKYKESV